MEDLALVAVAILASFALGALLMFSFSRAREAQLPELLRTTRERAAEETLKRSGATIKGQLGERFAPLLPGFGYEPADARFLGSPVDYVVFDGLSDGEIRGVAFVEVKTGGAWLTPFQKQLQEVLAGCCVKWRVVQLDE